MAPSEKTAKKSKRLIWVIGGLVALALITLLIIRFSAPPGAAVETGDIVTAFIGDLSASASASGKIHARREASLTMAVNGRVQQVLVQSGDQVQTGDPLVRLETGALERAVASAEQNLAIQEANLSELQAGPSEANIKAAEAAVASAQANLDDLTAGPRPEEIAASQANVEAAQANVWAASAQVGQASSGASQAEIAASEQQVAVARQQYEQARQAHEQTLQCFDTANGDEICPLLGAAEEQARANLQAAEANLATAQAQLDALLAGPNPDVVSGAQAGVSASSSQRDAAQAQLDLLLRGASHAQLAAATAQLAQAQASLASLVSGPTEERLAIAGAQVEQARISLTEAQEKLANATLQAPFAGTVTAVYVTEGEVAGGVVIELADTDHLEVVLDVDEVDIGELTVGQPAIVTLETWPNEEIESQIVAIAPQATSGPGGDNAIVTYQVRLALGQTDRPVRVGMTANARLITANRTDVLLVPNRAIIADREAGRYYVDLVHQGSSDQITTERVEVTIGLRDDRYTQVSSGLAEGDQVLIGEVAQQFQFGGPDSRPGNGGGLFGSGG